MAARFETGDPETKYDLYFMYSANEALPPEALSGEDEAVPKPRGGPKKTSKPTKAAKPPKALKPSAPAPVAPPKAPEVHWQRELRRTARGDIMGTAANAVTVLKCDPVWKDVVAFDQFAQRVVKLRTPRWHQRDKPPKFYRRPGTWTTLDTRMLRNWFEREYDMSVKKDDLLDAIDVYAHGTIVSGPRDYLRSLAWDGVTRLDTWLTTYGGAADKPYVRAVGAMWMISAVARAFRPGCQVDHSLVLEGRQGLGKSSLFRILVPNKDWFLVDIGSEFGQLDSFQKLKAKWIVELSELDSLSRSSLSAVKAFLTNMTDTYRRSYGHDAEDFPRTCVFSGTTNKDEYLVDEENRRFWPVLLTKIALRKLRADRDQLWAEAVTRFRAGAAWHIVDPFLLAAAKAEQGRRVQTHPWERPIAEHLVSPEVQRDGITVHELLAVLKVRRADQNPSHEQRIVSILKKLGWGPIGKSRKRIGNHRVRKYFMGSGSGPALASKTRPCAEITTLDRFRDRARA